MADTRGEDPLTEKIIGFAIEAHRHLGPGLLCHELEHSQSIRGQSSNSRRIRYIGRAMGDGLEIRRKRLRFRSWRRGTREADLLLGSFAEEHIAAWGAAELDRYERLLAASDTEIFDWIAGRAEAPPEQDGRLLRLLANFRYHRST
jgi:antitoxin CptB